MTSRFSPSSPEAGNLFPADRLSGPEPPAYCARRLAPCAARTAPSGLESQALQQFPAPGVGFAGVVLVDVVLAIVGMGSSLFEAVDVGVQPLDVVVVRLLRLTHSPL